MFRKSLILIAIICLASIVVSGCSTPRKKINEEISGIKTRVDTLETRVEGVEAKQAEVERAVAEAPKAPVTVTEPSWPADTNFTTRTGSTTSKANIKDVQTALKNAGYYSGKVDGVKGRNTKRAIKAFQRDHGLVSDGVAGKKTWDLLSKYLSGGGARDEGVATK